MAQSRISKAWSASAIPSFALVSDVVANSIVSLSSIHVTLLPTYNPIAGGALVLWNDTRIIQEMRVLLDGVTVVGSPWNGALTAVRLQGAGQCIACTFDLHNVVLTLLYAADGYVTTFMGGVVLMDTVMVNSALSMSSAHGSNDAVAALLFVGGTTSSLDNVSIVANDCTQATLQISAVTVSTIRLELRNFSISLRNTTSSSLRNLGVNALPVFGARQCQSFVNSTIRIFDVELSNGAATLGVALLFQMQRVTDVVITVTGVVNVGTGCGSVVVIGRISEWIANSTVALQSCRMAQLDGVVLQVINVDQVVAAEHLRIVMSGISCTTDNLRMLQAMFVRNITRCVACWFQMADVRLVSSTLGYGLYLTQSVVTGRASSIHITNLTTTDAIMLEAQNTLLSDAAIDISDIVLNSNDSLSTTCGILVFTSSIVSGASVVIGNGRMSASGGASVWGVTVRSSTIITTSTLTIFALSILSTANAIIFQAESSWFASVAVSIDVVSIESPAAAAADATVGVAILISCSVNALNVTIKESSVAASSATLIVVFFYLTNANNSRVLTTNTTSSGTLGYFIGVSNGRIDTVAFMMDNISCSLQSGVIQLLLLPQGSRVITVAVTRSHFTCMRPIRVDSCFASRLLLSVATSTLAVVSDTTATDDQYNAIGIADSSLSNCSITVAEHTRSVCSGVVAPTAAVMILLTNVILLDGSNVSVALASIDNCGGIVTIDNCLMNTMSRIDIRVQSNITVVPSFKRGLVNVVETMIVNQSSVRVYLPQRVWMALGVAILPMLHFDSVTLSGSSLLILPVDDVGGSSLTWRGDSAISVVDTALIENSRFVFSGLDATTTTTSTVVNISTCYIFTSSQFVMSVGVSSTLSINAVGLAFDSVVASDNATIVLEITCGVVPCVTVYGNQWAGNSSMIVDVSRAAPGVSAAVTITYSAFDGSLVEVRVPHNDSASSICIIGSYFSFSSLPAPQQQLLLVTPAGGGGLSTLYLQSTTFDVPWAEMSGGLSAVLLNAASNSTTSGITIVATIVTVFGLTAFVTAPPFLVAATTGGLVSSMNVTCCWWSRHSFSSGDAVPLQVALSFEATLAARLRQRRLSSL